MKRSFNSWRKPIHDHKVNLCRKAIHSSPDGRRHEVTEGKAFLLEEGGIREDDGWSKPYHKKLNSHHKIKSPFVGDDAYGVPKNLPSAFNIHTLPTFCRGNAQAAWLILCPERQKHRHRSAACGG